MLEWRYGDGLRGKEGWGRETLREGTREAEKLRNSVEKKRKRIRETRNSVENAKGARRQRRHTLSVYGTSERSGRDMIDGEIAHDEERVQRGQTEKKGGKRSKERGLSAGNEK